MSEPELLGMVREAGTLAASASTAQRAFTQRGNWFADLKFVWFAVIVRKTGRRIGLKDLTPVELAKFFSYFGPVLIQSAWARLRGVARLSVFFTPDRPRPWYVVWSACALSGVRIAKSEADADAVMCFEDVTVAAPGAVRLRTPLNGGCGDIRKSTVTAAFDRIASYKLSIDPLQHEGVAVEKGEENGLHDGRIVVCPVPSAPGKVYQRFVDSSDGVTAYDYRTTIIGRRPRFVLVKSKPIDKRFSIHNSKVVFRALAQVFSADEVTLLTRFAEGMALDWAAIDVLRDRIDGRIYVVDVNRTDTGPAVDLSFHDRERLKREIALGFREIVESAVRAADKQTVQVERPV